MHGAHAVQWWSRRQSQVALSSCEAEVNALVKGAAEALQVVHLSLTFGASLRILMKTDSSAAKGVMMRAGGGKIKHLAAKQLWLQEFVAKGDILMEKIPRDVNFSDALTHGWSERESKYFADMGFDSFLGDMQPESEGGC